jgi:hypothetical protein
MKRRSAMSILTPLTLAALFCGCALAQFDTATVRVTIRDASRAVISAAFQTDVRLQKNFPLHWENSRLEFQAECFNLLNKTNFAAPNANRSNSNFGTITSAFAPRIMQFALRFAF